MYGTAAGNRCEEYARIWLSDRALDRGAQRLTSALNSFCQSSNSPPCGFLNGVMKSEP